MSLVAYDDSGSSEYEDDDQVTSTVTLNKPVEGDDFGIFTCLSIFKYSF